MGHVSARWFYVLLKEMHIHGHQVDVLSSYSKEEEYEISSQLLSHFDGVRFFAYPFDRRNGIVEKVNSFVSPGSYQFSKEFVKKYQLLTKEADMIHCEQLSTAMVSSTTKAQPIVVNIHHLFSVDLADEKIYSLKEGLIRKRQFVNEKKIIKKLNYATTVSSELGRHLKKINPKINTEWIPFSLSFDEYQVEERERVYDFGLVGNMNWFPSFSAAVNVIEKIWPSVIKKCPTAKLLVAGWGADTKLSQYKDTPGLTLLSDAPSILEVFNSIGTLLYFPNKGSGVKVKILEALLMKCAVITNEAGVEGLHPQVIQNINVCNNLQEFISSAINVNQDHIKRDEQGSLGRESVLKNHSSKESYDKLMSFHGNASASFRVKRE